MAIAPIAETVETPKDFGTDDAGKAKRWISELTLAKKPRARWTARSKKIIKRYSDERPEGDQNESKRFNVLWSNVQTLRPAIYAKTPKPVVERRYLDKDPVGRAASVILERALAFEVESSYYHDSVNLSVTDYLLSGQGTVWVRYEPEYGNSTAHVTAGAEGGNTDGPSEPTEPEQEDAVAAGDNSDGEYLKSEALCTDYVHWTDFLCSVARTWDEVRWVARRTYLTRTELIARFGDKVGKLVPLDFTPDGMDKDAGQQDQEAFKKAQIWEIWDKDSRKVIFISEAYGTAPLEERDDPLKLQCFWPMPRPLLTTLNNETVIPIPDYVEYQDQADELDDLTNRISLLTKAIKAAGVYDASVPALQRLLDEGEENKLYAVENWQGFSEKGGMPGAISMLPIKEMAEVLVKLHEARALVKADLYEITGISDIVRGQTSASETATAQQIKSNFATLRLDDRKNEVARYCRDIIRIMGELIAEHFSPETLILISGWKQYAAEQGASLLPQQPQAPQMGHNGGPPMQGGMPPPQQPGMPAQAPMPPQGMMGMPGAPEPIDPAMQLFNDALALLRNDKLRGFRVDIETDSTVEPDRSQEKKDRTEFLTAATGFLEKAGPIAQMDPNIKPLLGKLLLFGVRGFATARGLETSFEEYISKSEQAAANPQPPKPSPEEQKAQGEMQLLQAQGQMDQQKHGLEMQALQAKTQSDIQIKRAELEIKQQELALKKEEMALEQQRMVMDAQMKQQEMQQHEREHAMTAEATATGHAFDMETMAAKANADQFKAKQSMEPQDGA